MPLSNTCKDDEASGSSFPGHLCFQRPNCYTELGVTNYGISGTEPCATAHSYNPNVQKVKGGDCFKL